MVQCYEVLIIGLLWYSVPNELICNLIGYCCIPYIWHIDASLEQSLGNPPPLFQTAGCRCFCVVCCLLCHFILGVLEQMFMFVYLCMRASVNLALIVMHLRYQHMYLCIYVSACVRACGSFQ